jgi:small subunit ribosomal protein S21
MIIIEVKKNNIEQALKQYKFKVYKTKQLEILRDRQEFVKKSVKNRKQKIKASYIQKLKNQLSS